MLQEKIHTVRSWLKWPVDEKALGHDYFQIVSFPLQKKHVIYLPAPDSPAGPPREIEMLHELIHALLAEQVHHQFSGQYFKRGTPEEHIHAVRWACRAAADWFVDARLIKLVPDQEKQEIQEHFDLISRIFKAGPPQNDVFFLLSSGFIIAQSIKYLGAEIAAAGHLKRIVNAFLSTSPENPTVQILEKLINKLLGIYSGFRVFLTRDSLTGIEVWGINTSQFK